VADSFTYDSRIFRSPQLCVLINFFLLRFMCFSVDTERFLFWCGWWILYFCCWQICFSWAWWILISFDWWIFFQILLLLMEFFFLSGDIKMLYIFVDIKIDSLHFVETVKANLDLKERISLGRSSTLLQWLMFSYASLNCKRSWNLSAIIIFITIIYLMLFF
jgi:hypothetical protein